MHTTGHSVGERSESSTKPGKKAKRPFFKVCTCSPKRSATSGRKTSETEGWSAEERAPEARARRSIGRRYRSPEVPGSRIVKSAGAVEDLTMRPHGTTPLERRPMRALCILERVFIDRLAYWQRLLTHYGPYGYVMRPPARPPADGLP